MNITLVDDKIYIKSDINIENVNIEIYNIYDDVIYSGNFNLLTEITIWIQPDNKTYLNGFYVKIVKNYVEIYKSDTIPTIYLISTFYNEEKILPFFIDHYLYHVGVSKIILYNNNSTDESVDICKKYNNVVVIDKFTETYDEYNHTDFKNNVWKTYRDECDWVIICDIDEFLYHPNIKEKLIEYKNLDITIPKIKGYNMISLQLPIYGKNNYMINIIRDGYELDSLNKNIIFNPKKIIEINYSLGSHSCSPIGQVNFGEEYESLNLLHYKLLSYEYYKQRCNMLNKRLDDKNKQEGIVYHWGTDSYIEEEIYLSLYHKKEIVVKNMIHYYNRISGFFDFEDIYSDMVNIVKEHAHFVEIGSWLGKSSVYMGVEIFNSHKNIKFDCIDIWKYDESLSDFKGFEQVIENDNIENVYIEFIKNIRPLSHIISYIRETSKNTVKLYEDESIDFVFIDANHDYEYVLEDINLWLPKVKKNGYIGGHDYTNSGFPGVKRAVDEVFGENNITKRRNSWLFKKNE